MFPCARVPSTQLGIRGDEQLDVHVSDPFFSKPPTVDSKKQCAELRPQVIRADLAKPLIKAGIRTPRPTDGCTSRQSPNVQVMPTSGSQADEYHLLWATWGHRVWEPLAFRQQHSAPNSTLPSPVACSGPLADGGFVGRPVSELIYDQSSSQEPKALKYGVRSFCSLGILNMVLGSYLAASTLVRTGLKRPWLW